MKFVDEIKQLLENYPKKYMNEKGTFPHEVMREMYDGAAQAMFIIITAMSDKIEDSARRQEFYSLIRETFDDCFEEVEVALKRIRSH